MPITSYVSTLILNSSILTPWDKTRPRPPRSSPSRRRPWRRRIPSSTNLPPHSIVHSPRTWLPTLRISRPPALPGGRQNHPDKYWTGHHLRICHGRRAGGNSIPFRKCYKECPETHEKDVEKHHDHTVEISPLPVQGIVKTFSIQ